MFDDKGQVVGVAFSGLSGGAENIGASHLLCPPCVSRWSGYIIPKPVIDNFLFDFKHTKSAAVATFGLELQLCENEALRRKYNLVAPNSCVYAMRHHISIEHATGVYWLQLSSRLVLLPRLGSKPRTYSLRLPDTRCDIYIIMSIF